MENDSVCSTAQTKKRIFPTLELTLNNETTAPTNLSTSMPNHPTLEIQSPKTPTLSRKLKAVSLDSDPPKQSTSLDVCRDVFSMPNTPKRQVKHKLSCDLDETTNLRSSTLTPNFSSNLKKFASNNSISGSQTLKTLPEVMTLHDFSLENNNVGKVEPQVRIGKARGLLERRGSNASLTIDLGSNSSLSETKTPLTRLNTAKSVSNLYLSSYSTGAPEKCGCDGGSNNGGCGSCVLEKRRKSQQQETCGNCVIYESVASTKMSAGRAPGAPPPPPKKCSCGIKCRRKSLSNENLYVPPCGFCQKGACKECTMKCANNKGGSSSRRACFPRQPDLEASQLLSEDFKLHLQNVQYLQTAGSVLTIEELRKACEMSRVPKLHSEFWEVPLNLQEKCYVSGSQSRNRYKGVLPNEHSRVHLPGAQNYIHANYIKGPDYTETAYIATQGPMAHTCLDFWDMVWHSNCVYIVMLTGLVEKGRNKCELYFPLGKSDSKTSSSSSFGQPGATKSFFYVKTTRERDKFTFDTTSNKVRCHNVQPENDEEIVEFEELNEIEFNHFKIKYVGREQLGEGVVIRHLEVTNRETRDTRLVHHYWFPNWQDHKMANPVELLKMAVHLLNRLETIATTTNHKQNNNKKVVTEAFLKFPPVVVHCSAGIGRTGCFLAILNGIQQLRINKNVDVLAILCSLRLNRGGMVQTAEQYELIHKVLNLYAAESSLQ